jgi:hypothetical protein
VGSLDGNLRAGLLAHAGEDDTLGVGWERTELEGQTRGRLEVGLDSVGNRVFSFGDSGVLLGRFAPARPRPACRRSRSHPRLCGRRRSPRRRAAVQPPAATGNPPSRKARVVVHFSFVGLVQMMSHRESATDHTS